MNFALLLISSYAIGVAVTAPIGPVNLMVIRTALGQGFWAGAWVGLGSVMGDGIFAAIAVFGVTALFSFFEDFALPLQLGGGFFMIVYGLYVLLAGEKEKQLEDPQTPKKVIGNLAPIGATLALTLTNPGTMLGFVGLFTALSSVVDYTSSHISALLVVAGVMMGSLSWICCLSAFISWLHKNISGKSISYINRGTAIALIIFGVAVLARLVFATH